MLRPAAALVACALALTLGTGCSGKKAPDSTSAPAGGAMDGAGSGGATSGSSSDTSGTGSSSTGSSMSGSSGGSMSGSMHGHHRHGGSMAGGTNGSSGTNGSLAEFPTEVAAQQHCPSGTVVWLNLSSHVYHLKGTPRYGTTKHGTYVCQADADAAGDRAAKEGS